MDVAECLECKREKKVANFFSLEFALMIAVQKEKQGSILPTYLHTAFTCADPKSAVKQLHHKCIFLLLGSARVKALCIKCW